MTLDTVFALFSCTKAITGTAVLQCVEEGRLDLDAPARRYVPEIGELRVLDGFDEAGELRLRPPKRDITTRMLMLHTAGFGYPYFNAALKRLATEHGQPDPRHGSKRGLMTPLLFDPGKSWQYGLGLDWAGQVVEAVVGERLDAVLRARVFRAPRHGRHRLRSHPNAAGAPRRDASAGPRRRSCAGRLRTAGSAGGLDGRQRPVRDRLRLSALPAHVAERRDGRAAAAC